jgi:hypothetical protein
VPDPRFILADNSDPLSQRLPPRPIHNIVWSTRTSSMQQEQVDGGAVS